MGALNRAVVAASVLGLAGVAMGEENARAAGQTATGYVFHDINGNERKDAGEPGVSGVLVSNERDVVMTDGSGYYELPVDDDTILFVIKPRNWRTLIDDHNLPRFYYIHKPKGSPDLKYGGVAPTGPLPESVDFPLYPTEEPDRFNVILFGDPQPYSIEQVNEFAQDIIPEVIDFVEAEGAAFGVSLGDLVGDDLNLFHPLNDFVSSVGIPWRNVYGNHDMDFDSPGDEHADETFNRVYGPTTYAFQYGPALFVVIDNVIYNGPTEDRPKGSYQAGLTDDQRAFLNNFVDSFWPKEQHAQAPLTSRLKRVRRDAARWAELRSVAGEALPLRYGVATLFFTMMHIPAVEFDNPAAEIISPYARAQGAAPLSIAAHWHRQHYFPLEGGHHHLVHATTSGSWWQGAPDEFGIPHTMMRDGKPNGWSVLTVDPELERGYEVRFKPARRPWSDQMHIVAPDAVWPREAGETDVVVNLYSGSELSKVEMRVVHAGDEGAATGWKVMETFEGVDPYWRRLKDLQETDSPPPGRKLTGLNAETTLWRATLPAGLQPGTYTIEVREENMYGHVHTKRRVIRVLEE